LMKGYTLVEILVVIVIVATVIVSIYSGFIYEPEITCINGYQYEEEYDGDFEPITDWFGRRIPCE